MKVQGRGLAGPSGGWTTGGNTVRRVVGTSGRLALLAVLMSATAAHAAPLSRPEVVAAAKGGEARGAGPVRTIPPRHLGAYLVDAREVVEKILIVEEGEVPERGAVVVLVEEGGPADQAGLRPADAIVELAGERVEATADLLRILGSRAVGVELPLTYVRDGRLRAGTLTVAGPDGKPPEQAVLSPPSWAPHLRLH